MVSRFPCTNTTLTYFDLLLPLSPYFDLLLPLSPPLYCISPPLDHFPKGMQYLGGNTSAPLAVRNVAKHFAGKRLLKVWPFPSSTIAPFSHPSSYMFSPRTLFSSCTFRSPLFLQRTIWSRTLRGGRPRRKYRKGSDSTDCSSTLTCPPLT